ncbi:hypothetical protein OB08_09430, partial [Microbacterium sp. HJ5]
MSAVAASVAVVCAVALTNSAALSDAQGAAVDAAPVVVPSSGTPSDGVEATPPPVAGPAPVDVVPAPAPDVRAESPAPPVAEVVPAPAPQVVTPSTAAPVAPPAGGAAAGTGGSAAAPSEKAVIAAARASGSWEAARAWATRLGWSPARIDAWIAKIEQDRDALSGGRDQSTGDGGRAGLVGPGDGDR